MLRGVTGNWRLRVVVGTVMALMVGAMVLPALAGWRSHSSVDALGWANYALLGLKLGLGAMGLVWYFASQRQDEAQQ